MEALVYIQRRRRRTDELFERLSGELPEIDRRAAIEQLSAQLDDLAQVEGNRIFPVLERHELLREWVSQLREQHAQIKLCSDRMIENGVDSCFRDLVVEHFEVLEKDLLPLAGQVLSGDEVRSLSEGLEQEVSQPPVAA